MDPGTCSIPHRALIALLLSTIMCSSAVLIANVPFGFLFTALLVTPVSIMVAWLPLSSESFVPITPIAIALYALLFFPFLGRSAKGILARFTGPKVLLLALPAALLFGLTFLPQLNIFLPHHMDELATQERELREALPVGMELATARAALQARGIAFNESLEEQETEYARDDRNIVIQPGDHLLYTRVPTDAWQFPCRYDIEVYLMTGKDGRVRDRYVNRYRICM